MQKRASQLVVNRQGIIGAQVGRVNCEVGVFLACGTEELVYAKRIYISLGG
jgi:hypothetical protein